MEENTTTALYKDCIMSHFLWIPIISINNALTQERRHKYKGGGRVWRGDSIRITGQQICPDSTSESMALVRF